MKPARLVRRALVHYWRTNLAVLLGIATAVTVLAGALLVGDSVRGSLRGLVLEQLGGTDYVVTASGFFREQLAADLESDSAFAEHFQRLSPLIVMNGLAIDQESGRRVLGVQVYGVDDRFWQLMASDARLGGPRELLVSPALARDLGAAQGATVLLRIQRPSDIPVDSLHGRKEELGQTVRFSLRDTVAPGRGGNFSLLPQQGEVRAAFVSLARMQDDLDLERTVNAVIVSQKPDADRRLEPLLALVRRYARIEDLGLKVRALDARQALSLESGGSLVTDAQAGIATEAAKGLGMTATPILTYLVNEMRSGERSVPYSLVTAIDLQTVAPALEPGGGAPPIVLNEWASRDLGAKAGDPLTLKYYVWEESGVLVERQMDFRIAAVVPLAGAAADRDLAPSYPGITDTENLRDWDPPFPLDLRRIRPVDEEYWKDYRTTPKAFIPLEVGQSLWRSRYGALTSVRVAPAGGDAAGSFLARLATAFDPFTHGFSARDVRSEGLAASRGATDFGEYFTYFSFFLVVSALLLAVLFFKLGVEQRGREVGLLRAVGFADQAVRSLFVKEALLLSIAGSVVGVFGAIAYGALMMAGLRTWWVDAVGTTALTLHVSPVSLLAGAAGGVAAAVAAIWWTLRRLSQVSERSLLAGDIQLAGDSRMRPRVMALAAAAFLVLGLLLVAGGAAGLIAPAGAFFGAGAALLAACLAGVAAALRRAPGRPLAGHGLAVLSRLGFRHASHRPGRTVLAIAVIASATFVLISVGVFRKGAPDPSNPRSGTGGYSLIVDALLPIVSDPNSPEGRELIGLDDASDVTITPFRVLPGEDASCLNLYAPRQPRIVAVSPAFVQSGRFAFQGALAESDAEHENPWRLLERQVENDVIPVIADANSMTYVLHRALGDEIEFTRGGQTLRLRLVAALADSIFQSELLMSEANFLRLFPEQAGYRLLLVSAPASRQDEIASTVEDRLSDFGADATPAAARLAEFHKVENTYLSTFQALGGLGLLLGTIGLSAILLRNVFERRRELALLGAVGYQPRNLVTIVLAENLFLLCAGIVAGTLCALIAIAPAAVERGGRLPVTAAQWLLLAAVLLTGIVSSLIATRAAVQTRLLTALRGE
jgi:ABC-type antimicrobial peptide transport system permease subunit